MKFNVLINKNAGGGKAGFFIEKIENVFKRNDVSEYEIFLSNTTKESETIIKKINDGILITAGGDGTINQAINTLIKQKKKIPLAHLAIGSGNDFVRSINRLNWQSFLTEIIANELKPSRINIGHIEGENIDQYFINSFGIGFDAQVVIASQDPKLKEKYKSFAYFAAILKVFRTKISFNLEVDKTTLKNSFMLIVANNRFIGGGIEISPESNIENNKLNVISGLNYSIPSVIKLFLQIFTNKKHLQNKNIYYSIKKKPFTIKGVAKKKSQIDGEIIEFKDNELQINATDYQIFI